MISIEFNIAKASNRIILAIFFTKSPIFAHAATFYWNVVKMVININLAVLSKFIGKIRSSVKNKK